MLRHDQFHYMEVWLRQNDWATYDNIFFAYETLAGSFFDIGKILSSKLILNEGPFKGVHYMQKFSIYGKRVVHEREVYTLLDMLSEWGGIKDIIVSICGIVIFPWSEYCFNYAALRTLFMIKTPKNTILNCYGEHDWEYDNIHSYNKLPIPKELKNS